MKNVSINLSLSLSNPKNSTRNYREFPLDAAGSGSKNSSSSSMPNGVSCSHAMARLRLTRPQYRPMLLCAVLLVIGFVIQYECLLAAIQHSSPRHAPSAACCHVANRNASAFHSSNFNSFQVACSAARIASGKQSLCLP